MTDKMKQKRMNAKSVREFSEEAWWLIIFADYARETYDSSKKVAISSQAIISIDMLSNILLIRLFSGLRDNFGPRDLRTWRPMTNWKTTVTHTGLTTLASLKMKFVVTFCLISRTEGKAMS